LVDHNKLILAQRETNLVPKLLFFKSLNTLWSLSILGLYIGAISLQFYSGCNNFDDNSRLHKIRDRGQFTIGFSKFSLGLKLDKA
jgi:hypothetical protein